MRISANDMRLVKHGALAFGVFLLLMAAFAAGGSSPETEPVAAPAVERTVDETPPADPSVALAAVTTTPPTTAPPTTAPPTTTTPEEPPVDSTTTTTTTTTTVPALDSVTFDALARIDTIRDYTDFTTQGVSRWRQSIDGLEELTLVSSADGAEQPVFWLPPTGDDDQPVLVILHSWSSRYTQHAGIPFAEWAQENGWAMIAPEFRGKNDHANAVGSDLAVQDVVDAIDYAVAQDGVDPERVFLVGYSGGGMMSLLVAGQHPEKVAALSAWGPPHDLANFYDFARGKGLSYWEHIGRACGGDPRQAGAAHDECVTRSPTTYLETIREHDIPVFIGQGIWDPFVMRNAAADVYNALADPLDQLSADDVELLRRGQIPGDPADAVTIETHFEERDPDPVFARQSGSVLMVYFAAEHDMVYGAAAEWLASDPGHRPTRSSLPWENET